MHKVLANNKNALIVKAHYWTDSQITLSRIQAKNKKWKTFVSNRVGEIQELSNPKMVACK